jgi:hypothetical protein
VHARTEDAAAAAARALRRAYHLGGDAAESGPIVLTRIGDGA